jgi:AcrR family transcriptional regulator
MPDESTPEKNGTRELLLEAAERLFAQKGFDSVTVRQLAKAAGVNGAMVSYHFDSKNGLLAALIDEKFPHTREQMFEIANSFLDPWEKLLATVDVYAEKIFDGYNFHRIIMREMSLSQRPEVVEIITGHFAHILSVIRGFILEGQEKGIFRPVDVELTLATVFGSFSTLIGQGKLLCIMLKEDCEDNIYSEKSRDRFISHLKELLRVHLMKEK